jgi:integrase
MNLRRTRYQQGSLTIERRKSGSSLWVYRWRETGQNGQATRRKQIVGLKSEFPSGPQR